MLAFLGDHFVDESPVLATAPAPAPGPAPVPAPQSTGAGPLGPADTLPEVPSRMQRRRKQRLFEAGASGGSGDGESTPPGTPSHKVMLTQELTRYVAEGVHADTDDFSLPGFWLRRSSPTLAEGTTTSVAPAEMPHLGLIARLYRGVEATSCQSERNFSSLSFLLASLRSTMGTFKVEQMMFLRLNQGFIPEVKKAYQEMVTKLKDRREKCVSAVASVQGAAAGETVVVDLVS